MTLGLIVRLKKQMKAVFKSVTALNRALPPYSWKRFKFLIFKLVVLDYKSRYNLILGTLPCTSRT